MTDRITVAPAPGLWVVRAGGAVIAETANAVRLEEMGYEPVIYFPRADIAMELIDPSPTRTTCPHKGEASYWTIVAKSGPITDAAWSYETPHEGLSAIAGHLAFRHERVAVEQI